MQADDLALAIRVGGHSDYRRHRDNTSTLTLLGACRVEPEIGPIAGQRAVEEGVHAIVDTLAGLADRALADPRRSHGPHQVVDAPGRDAADPVDPRRGSTLGHGHQGLLRRLAGVEKGRETSALAQLRDANRNVPSRVPSGRSR